MKISQQALIANLIVTVSLINNTKAQSCYCWTDQDCLSNRNCPTTCARNWITGISQCIDAAVPPPPVTWSPVASPMPDPTSAPVRSGSGSLGAPSVCQVRTLIAFMEEAVRINKAIAPQWLRLAFHDAGTFNVNFQEGGANGCLLTDDAMREQPENHNLDLAIETLQVVQAAMLNHQDSIRLSSADMIQFAGLFVAVRQRDIPGLSPAKETEIIQTIRWGRPDETNCNIAWTLNLPDFQLGAGSGDIPQRCAFAGSEIREKMMERNGFSAREATALVGAHTIGLTRNVFGRDLAGPWNRNGADDATPEGPVFDNAYHQFLVDTISTTTVDEFSSTRFPFDEEFPNWFRSSPINVNHLDTDIVLAFPSQDTNIHPHFDRFSKEFSASNEEFIGTFMRALNKMSLLGVNIDLEPAVTFCTSLNPPSIPLAPASAPPPSFSEILLDSIDMAEERLNQTLVDREEEIQSLTTPVDVEA